MSSTLTIGELAREFDLTTRAIRFYEDSGLLAPQRSGRNRVYTQRDRTRLKLTLRGKRLGLTLAEVKELVDMYESPRDTLPQLKKFLEDGGTILAVGRSAMNLAELMALPVDNHLVERSPDGTSRQLPSEKFYVPGSVLRVAVDNTSPIAHGITSELDVFYDNSPVFRLEPEATLRGVRPVAWFDSPNPLRSGWAYGQGYLQGGVAVVDASVGKGKLFLFGPEITFRAQPHGTFKFLFNGIYYGTSVPSGPAAGTTTVQQ